MKKFLIIIGCMATVAVIVSCNNTRRDTGSAYMPDMAYSRAYETYGELDSNKFTHERADWGTNDKTKIYYTNMPVAGTMARGDMAPYPFKNDSAGYTQSASVKNPLSADSIDMKEADRLYQVNCGICHGAKLDGNGPLYKGGEGPYPAAPKNLMADDMKALSDGTMFHSITYGKNAMGSYASQLNTKQRWMVISYIRNKQGGGKMPMDSVMKTAADTTAAAVKTK